MTDAHNTQVNCKCCGAVVAVSLKQCEYCGNPVLITTLKSTAGLSKPILMKYAKAYDGDEDAMGELAKGLIFLRLGQFEKAAAHFDETLMQDPTNAEAYFYSAVAGLGGKKPFLCPRPIINKALEDIGAARELGDNPVYQFLAAVIKYDYFDRKGYRISPNYQDELSELSQSQLGSGDVEALLTILNVKLPSSFPV